MYIYRVYVYIYIYIYKLEDGGFDLGFLYQEDWDICQQINININYLLNNKDTQQSLREVPGQ
jgi:hypothetical protein